MNSMKQGHQNEDPKHEKSGLSRLGDILGSTMDGGSRSGKNKKAFIPPGEQPELKILSYLRPVPWVLLCIFLFSFYWDFDAFHVTLFGNELEMQGLLRIISVSGFIGFLTNWIAITMLFRPIRKRPLLGQGLIPAQKNRIAYRLSLAVSDDLINPDIIRKKIEESDTVKKYRRKASMDVRKVFQNPDVRNEIKRWVIDSINSFLDNDSVKKHISMEIADEIEQKLADKPIERAAVKTYALLRGKQLNELIETVLDEIPFTLERKIDFIDDILDEIPAKMEENSEQLDDAITTILFNIVNRFDVQQLVEENLRQYDEKKLEEMIQNATNEQLKTIQYLGAVLGTIGGFVIWQPILSMLVLGTAGGSVYLIDRWLYQ
jgi:uncharacterized membrane protein YheB (UPF0754 family)